MNKLLADHPAVIFGEWLCAKRKEKRIIAREFARRVRLTSAEFAEVEAGVVMWIEESQERLIPLMLGLSTDEEADYQHKLFLAREANGLKFEDIFTRDQLAPTRCCTKDGNPITEQQANKILDAVFTPLIKARV